MEQWYELTVEPMPRSFDRLGWDAVQGGNHQAFGCSPLSCNAGCRDVEIAKRNRYCLVSTEGEGIDLARHFSICQPEPGPLLRGGGLEAGGLQRRSSCCRGNKEKRSVKRPWPNPREALEVKRKQFPRPRGVAFSLTPFLRGTAAVVRARPRHTSSLGVHGFGRP
jgi:hypothetical protein